MTYKEVSLSWLYIFHSTLNCRLSFLEVTTCSGAVFKRNPEIKFIIFSCKTCIRYTTISSQYFESNITIITPGSQCKHTLEYFDKWYFGLKMIFQKRNRNLEKPSLIAWQWQFGLLGVKVLLCFVVYVLISKIVITLQTATLCLRICSQCLLPLKLYYLGKMCLWSEREADTEKKTCRNKRLYEGVWRRFTFILRQVKC